MKRLLIVTLLAAVACGGELPPDPPQQSVVGLYHLRTVNSQALPYVQSDAPSTITAIASGTLELTADGRYTQTTTSNVTAPGSSYASTTVQSGPYTFAGSTLDLLVGSYHLTAQLIAGTITLQDGSRLLVYSRNAP